MKRLMKVTLHAQPSPYAEDGFNFTAFSIDDLSGQGYIACDTVEVEFDLPPRDVLNSCAIKTYRDQQNAIRAKAQLEINRLEDAVQKLLCIAHKQ